MLGAGGPPPAGHRAEGRSGPRGQPEEPGPGRGHSPPAAVLRRLSRNPAPQQLCSRPIGR